MKIPKINIYNANKENLSDNKPFHKHILDLVRKKVSINGIKNHFKELFDLYLNRNEIIDIIRKYSKIAKRKNRLLDEYVCKQLFILEIDEIFKGRKYMLLVVVDKVTGYVYLIQSLPDRKNETIINALQPLKHLFQKVEIVFTDGASYYPEVVKEVFPNAIHFICLLHVIRNLNKRAFPKKKNHQNAIKKYRKHQLKTPELKQKLKERRYKKQLFEKQINYYFKKREILREQYGFTPYQKNIKGLYSNYDKCYQKLNEIRTKQRSITKTINNNKSQLESTKIEGDLLKINIGLSWNKYMQDKKLIKSFYDLYLLNGVAFMCRHTQLLNLCASSDSESVKHGIFVFLSQPASYTYHLHYEGRISVPRNYLNTNGVENVNSSLRYILDLIKKVYDSPDMEDYFELIRFFRNVSAPYGGPLKGISPVERYGYDLKSRTALDILVEGLPPGKQTSIYSPQIQTSIPHWRCQQKQ